MVAAVPKDHAGTDELTVIDSSIRTSPTRMAAESSHALSLLELLPRPPSRPIFDLPNNRTKRPDPPTAEDLHILVAEDDPINSKIMKKRLEKIGHTVQLTINGEECSSAYGDRAAFFDVVLMDMQVRRIHQRY